MDERDLLRILASGPPGRPVYRPRLDPARTGTVNRAEQNPRSTLGGRSLVFSALSVALLIVVATGALLLGWSTSTPSPREGAGEQAPSPGPTAGPTPQPAPVENGGAFYPSPPGPAWPSGRYVVRAQQRSAAGPEDFDLVFDVGASGPMSGSWNGHFVALEQEGPDGPTTEVWWSVPHVHGEACPGPVISEEDAMRYVDYPSPSAAYEMIRSIPEFDVSPERPFSFAGATGRSVDLRLSPEGRARCAPGGDLRLIDARGGAPCCALSFPRDAVLRIATVNVGGLDLLITVVAPTVDDLDRAHAVLETFSAEVRSTATPAGPQE